jgi:hypothetical protein
MSLEIITNKIVSRIRAHNKIVLDAFDFRTVCFILHIIMMLAFVAAIMLDLSEMRRLHSFTSLMDNSHALGMLVLTTKYF